MTTVLFVHGTGVRQPAYDAAFRRFAAEMARIRPQFGIAPCYWGGPCGSRLNAGGVSVPTEDSARGIDDIFSDEEAELALWAMLERDPFAELWLLSTVDGARAELAPNAAPPGERLEIETRRLTQDAMLKARLADAGLAEAFPSAVEEVLASATGRAALRETVRLGGTLRVALARAILSRAMLYADEELGGMLPLAGTKRNELVAMVVARLGGSDRGIVGAMGKCVLEAALRLGALRPVERRRAAITGAVAPVAGDVLGYLARGGAVREFIAQAIAGAGDSVVIVAHSLGGIASLELLATVSIPSVEMLITVGSQAPLLYELNALPTMEFGVALPASVPPWVNIFDSRDLLGYAGAGLFPGRVIDRVVINGAPFPRAHSAYFANPEFYVVLDEVMP